MVVGTIARAVPVEILDRALELNGHSEAFARAQHELETATAERENQWLYEACRARVRERRAAPLDPSVNIVSALLALETDDEFVAGCPGAGVARAELAVVLGELLARTSGFSVDGRVEMVPWPRYGPARLEVAFR